MKHHFNAGVDAALSGDGWEKVDAGDFKRSDNHVLNVWIRSFSSGSQCQIETTGFMVGGVVSNGCQAGYCEAEVICNTGALVDRIFKVWHVVYCQAPLSNTMLQFLLRTKILDSRVCVCVCVCVFVYTYVCVCVCLFIQRVVNVYTHIDTSVNDCIVYDICIHMQWPFLFVYM